MRSTAGGVAIPGGEGVRYSLSSPFISAMTPSKGAVSRVRVRFAFATLTRAMLLSMVALEA